MTRIARRIVISLVAMALVFTSLSWDGIRVVAEDNKTQTVFESATKDMRVTVTADKDVFPEGTKMVVKDVSKEDALAYANEAMGEENVVNALAVDITFYLGEDEIQPSDPSKVQVSLKPLKEDISEKDIVVLHVENETEKVTPVDDAEVADRSNSVSFESQGFSVYVVVQTGNDARLLVKFVKVTTEGTTEIASMYVKSGDDMEQVLYDPGVGNLPAGVVFKGWTTNADYTVETTGLTIDQVRTEVSGKLPPATDGTEVTYYAILIKQYIVTYLDETSSSLGQHIKELRADATATALEYEVNMAYTPADDEHDFEGWLVLSGSSNIQGYTEGQAYENGTTITISGDVTFAVNSPEGHWLVFNENGRGATYVAPKFIYSNAVTVEPTNTMIRKGYRFGGWFDSKAHADAHAADESVTTGQFEFGHTISDKTTVYASWIPAQTADYTVIIWKQNLDADGYDFEKAISLSGTVGNTVNTVVAQGEGSDSYARINGTDYRYTGFQLKSIDTNVTIETEGNSVVNVYYDRIQYTLTFRSSSNSSFEERTKDFNGTTYTFARVRNGNSYTYYVRLNNQWYQITSSYDIEDYLWSNSYPIRSENGHTTSMTPGGTIWTRYYSWSGQWRSFNISNRATALADSNIITTITALYGQDISGYFPIEGYEGYVWEPQNSSIYTTGDVPSVEQMREENTTFVAKRYGTYYTVHMYYYTEAIGNEPESSIVVHDGKRYVQHQHVMITTNNTVNSTEAEDFIDIAGYEHNGSVPAYDSDGKVSLNSNNNYTIKFYYKRALYDILFLDGAYFDGNGNPITEPSQGKLNEIDGIAYGADTSSYNNFKQENGPAGYVFEGWCADTKCTQPYDFTRMPEGGITVYAKWRQIQYRVFLHPNAGRDSTLDWGSETQAMNFRISWGGTVDTPTGLRKGYTFVGWYTDEACTQLFNKDAFVLNETTVTTPYNKETHLTDNMDKWGDIDPESPTPDGETGPGYNSDLWEYKNGVFTRRERTWVTKELNLYAKWRLTLEGADGIGVIYDKRGGTGTAEDTHTYVPGAMATAVAAVTAPTANQQFAYWVMQKWDEQANDYVDVQGSKINPGESYEINVDYAHKVFTGYKVDENNNWLDENGNITTDESKRVALYTYTIQLRAEFKPKEAATPTHIYWYANNGTDAVVKDEPLDYNQAIDIRPANTFSYANHTFVGWAKKADATEPWLKWENGKWYYMNNETWVETPYNKVAADEDQPYDNLYAIWSANVTAIIIGSEVSKVYNGSQQTNSTYTVKYYVGGQEVEELPSGVTFELTTTDYTAKGTNVGTYSTDVLAGELHSDNPLYVVPENAVTVDEENDKVTLIITPAPVTLTGLSDTKVYNGLEQTISGFTSSVNGLTFEGVTASGSRTAVGVTDVTFSGVTIGETKDTTGNYYVAEVVPGKLTITAKPVTVRIKGLTTSFQYDGEPKEYAGWTIVNESELPDGLLDHDTYEYDGDYTARGTDPGKYYMNIDASQFSCYNANYEVTFVLVSDGWLEIRPIPVRIIGGNETRVYNGSTWYVTASSYTCTTLEGDPLDLNFGQVIFSGQGVNVDGGMNPDGTYPLGYVANSVEGRVIDSTGKYEAVEFIPGKLTITPLEITVTANSKTWPYDGTAHSDNGYTVTYTYQKRNQDTYEIEDISVENHDGKLQGGDSLTVTVTGSITLPGQVTNAITATLSVVSPSVEKNYIIKTVPGTLTVTNAEAREITITAASDEWTYDGNPHTNTTVTLTEGTLFPGDTLVAEATGSVTNVADTEEGNNPVKAGYKIMHGDVDVSANYSIKVVNGTLTINPAVAKVICDSAEFVYDGTEHYVKTYTTDPSGITFPGLTIWGAETKAGTWVVGRFPGDLAQLYDSTGNYKLGEIVNGTLVIKKREITVKVEDRTTEYNGSEQYGNSEYTFNNLVSATEEHPAHTATITYNPSHGTLIDTYDNGSFGNDLIVKDGNGNDVTTNYELVTKTAGKLTITKRENPYAITVVAKSNTGNVYDGNEKSATGFETLEFTVDGNKYTVSGLTTSDPSSTNVCNLVNEISGTAIVKDEAGNDVTSQFTVKTTNGRLEIIAREIQVSVEDKTVEYNGSKQEGNTECNFTNLVSGHTATQLYTPSSGTLVGEYNNGAFGKSYQVLDAAGNDVSANYVITKYTAGKLTIIDRTKPYEITVVANSSLDNVYDGTEKSATGFVTLRFEVEDNVYFVSGLTTSNPKSTDVCEIENEISGTAIVKDAAGNDVTSQFTVNKQNGKLEITPLAVNVVIVGETREKVYNGEEQEFREFRVEGISNTLYTKQYIDYNGAAVAKGTNVGEYPMGLNENQFSNKNPNFTVTFIIKLDGKLIITPLAVTVTITGKTDSKTYNGEEQRVDGYTAESSDPLYPQNKGDIQCGKKPSAVGTNVGTYPMGLTAEDFSNQNKNFTVTFEVIDGELEITPKDVVVTIVGNNGSFDYDGKEHTVEGYTVTCDDKLYDTSNAVLINVVSHKEYNPIARRTDVGTSLMGIRLDLSYDGSIISCTPKNKDDNFKVIKWIITDGYVEINPVKVTITAKDAEKVYDGTPLTQPEFTVSGLKDGDTHEFKVEMTADSTITNAGTQPNVIATVDGVKVVAGEETAVGNYLVTVVDGTLTVKKLPIILKSASDSKEYDGTALTNDEVTIVGELPKGVTITFDVTGSQTLPGTSENTFTYTISKQRTFLLNAMRLFKAPAKAPSEEDNYDITVEYGTLEVTDRKEKYEVEFTAKSDEVTYDGKEHTVEGFTVDKLEYTNDKGIKYTITGITASGKGTNAGEYEVKVTGTPKVTDPDGNDVTAQFNVTTKDGKLVINPKEVTVTAKDYTKNIGTDDPKFEAKVEGLVGDDKVEYEIKREDGEEAGEYALTPEGEAEQGNYTVKFVAGTLTIVDNTPDTGDRTGIDFWYITMCMSMLAFIAILADMKKRKMFA